MASSNAPQPTLGHRRPTYLDHLIGLALCVGYVLILLASAQELGMARDEGFYTVAADRYGTWIEEFIADPDLAMTQEVVDRYWSYNHEHPPLSKTMFALSHLAQERWEIFEQPSLAYRFFGPLSGGLLLWLIYIFGVRLRGRGVGLVAALAFASIPRIFYHSQLCAFDIPIVLMLTWVTYCYWRALSSSGTSALFWNVLTGVAYGLALATKHNAWTLPGIFLIHWLFVFFSELSRRRKGLGRRISLVPYWLLAMALIGPPIFVYSWPWLWFDTLPRFSEYAGFHLNHVHYNMAYFGVNYFRPPLPMGYPWVLTLFTVPLSLLCLGFFGVGLRAKAIVPGPLLRLPGKLFKRSRKAIGSYGGHVEPTRVDVLLFGSLLAPLVVISMPWTPIFGGTKHWFSAYPAMALFAALGLQATWTALAAAWATSRQRKSQKRKSSESQNEDTQSDSAGSDTSPSKPALGLIAFLVSALCLAPGMLESAHSQNFGLSHYTFAAGGVPGAADHGMNRQFWGFTTGSLTDWFNTQLPEGGTVWICDTTWTAWQMLQRDGRLNANVRASADLVNADYAIVHHEHHFVEVDYQIWVAYGDVAPVHVLTYDGVPIVSIYENPRHRRRSSGRAAAQPSGRGSPVR